MKNEFVNLTGLKKGSIEAFSTLYRLYWKKVYHFARLYTPSLSDAEDAVQETFIKLWNNREQIDESKSIENYLFIITRNHLFNLLEKKKYEARLQLTALQALDIEASDNATEQLQLSELRKHINDIVNSLPPRQKEVFLMSRTQHLSHAEIAVRLTISQRAVERHVYLALRTLKKKLEALYGEQTAALLYCLL
ncbi:MAG: RNA polymerase sigma-70 factor [Mediterranea sp.]|jgi:RNA polymerase sigma-70 factor (ECF subfamily)|nr:RNA polymerase sigma-70 factor [Mediterranea sp.]